MTTNMGPPPPRSRAAAAAAADVTGVSVPESAHEATVMAAPSEQPASEIGKLENSERDSERNPSGTSLSGSGNSEQLPNFVEGLTSGSSIEVERKAEQKSNSIPVPYTIPPWSGAPSRRFFLEVLKDGAIIEQFDVDKKGAYMFGRVDVCDFMLEHPTISRFHAVLQFKSDGDAYVYDLGSTHGTFVNKKEVKKRVYVDLRVGDIIRFGHSSRLYIFQGPSELMPQEADLKSLRKARIQQDMHDMEASLLRAKLEASRADGISWGMREDAVEDDEDEVDEITWQNYKGQLTEKQEKTREKVIKRLEKIAHMRKEIDAIRAKDIAQGGLTQGQQTQIARNEQRITQIMEELENLEETLNDSIRESVGARSGRSGPSKKKGFMDDEEDLLSDDDEFYDRTKKPKKKSVESKAVETSDSLLDKKESLLKEIKDKEKLLVDDSNQKGATNDVSSANEEDALDAYMSAVSSQLVLDTKEKIQKELSSLRSELDRILYLLKLADPTGETARKRESAAQTNNTVPNRSSVPDEHMALPLKNSVSSKPGDSSVQEKGNASASSKPDTTKEEEESKPDANKPTPFTVSEPQWLGAVQDRSKQEISQEAPRVDDHQETDEFVDYKDRQTMLEKTEPSLEEAAPGLLIRKRKSREVPNPTGNEDLEQSSSSKFKAEDAVALLLKHSKGYHGQDEDDDDWMVDETLEQKPNSKRSSISKGSDYESWVPPQGQSGDGRTSLNDRFGY